MELTGVVGAPPSHPRVQRKLPSPFTRHRIDLDGGRQVKRAWQHISVLEVKKGDTVAGFGTVEVVAEFVRNTDENGKADQSGPVNWRIRLYNVMGDYRDYPGHERVFAFTKDDTA